MNLQMKIVALLAASAAQLQPQPSPHADAPQIGEVELAPLYDQPFACSEHPEGQLASLGDALGTDCMITGGITPAGGFSKMYRGDGSRNEDWYGLRANVRAPFDGIVKLVHINPATNIPGAMGGPPASAILFERADGLIVAYAHVQDVKVKVGDKVIPGQVIAVVGNNGMARNPHIHVGAAKDHKPLQIRWDLRAEGRIPSLLGD